MNKRHTITYFERFYSIVKGVQPDFFENDLPDDIEHFILSKRQKPIGKLTKTELNSRVEFLNFIVKSHQNMHCIVNDAITELNNKGKNKACKIADTLYKTGTEISKTEEAY